MGRREGLPDPLAYRLAQADRTRYLEGKAAELRLEGVEARISVQEGDAAEVIIDLLRGGAYDLVGLAPHGAGCGKHLRVGCSATAVILNAQTSILLAPSARDEDKGGGQIRLPAPSPAGSWFRSTALPGATGPSL